MADVVLTEDLAAGGAFAAPAGGVQAGLDALGTALTANPVAGTALTLLLRSCAGLSVPGRPDCRVRYLLRAARGRGVSPLADEPASTRA